MKNDINTIVTYMFEDGFLGPIGSMCYVVWLHGATDGWPRAIFDSREGAEIWISNVPMNPEGYSIDEVAFSDLVKELARRL